jgi:hypothetical protein
MAEPGPELLALSGDVKSNQFEAIRHGFHRIPVKFRAPNRQLD